MNDNKIININPKQGEKAAYVSCTFVNNWQQEIRVARIEFNDTKFPIKQN